MGFWSFVALCVVCGCLLEAYRAYVKSKAMRRTDVAALEIRIKALEGNDALEQRVRTLEAIVTDPKFQLHQELKQLEAGKPGPG